MHGRLAGFFFSPHSSSSAHLIPILFQPVWNDGAIPEAADREVWFVERVAFLCFMHNFFFPPLLALSRSLPLPLPITDCPSLGQILFMIMEEKEEEVVVVHRRGGGCPL